MPLIKGSWISPCHRLGFFFSFFPVDALLVEPLLFSLLFVFFEAYLHQHPDSFRLGFNAIVKAKIIDALKKFLISSKCQYGLFGWHINQINYFLNAINIFLIDLWFCIMLFIY